MVDLCQCWPSQRMEGSMNVDCKIHIYLDETINQSLLHGVQCLHYCWFDWEQTSKVSPILLGQVNWVQEHTLISNVISEDIYSNKLQIMIGLMIFMEFYRLSSRQNMTRSLLSFLKNLIIRHALDLCWPLNH